MLSSSIKISISKESSVPVRDQLIEQIGLQIASGTLKAKDKLPSIRALAQRLGIHHSTVTSAYNHLADAGLLDIRQGSGVRVAGRATEDTIKEASLEQLFRQFLARASESGMSRDEVRETVAKLITAKKVERILVVDRNVDFHPILISELQPHFDLPIEPITAEQLRTKQQLLPDSLLVTSFYHVFPLQALPIDPTRFIVCTVEPGSEELGAITSLKQGSIAAFVSVSNTLLKMATNMTAALRGEEVAVRTLLLSEKNEISYLMKHADTVICDRPSEKTVRELAGKVPVHAFRLYSPSTIELIKNRLKKWG